MGAGQHRCSIGTSEPFGEDWMLQPWADCPVSTNELIGEDSLGDH